MMRGMSIASVIRKLCLVTGIVMPEMSASWKPSVPIRRRADLSGDRDDRNGVHLRVGQWRDQVGRTGTRRRHADADLAGRLGVTGGSVARTLLVAHEHVADLDRIEEWVVDREHGTAGNAEYRVDLELFEGSNHRLRAGYPLRRRAGDGWPSGSRQPRLSGSVSLTCAAWVEAVLLVRSLGNPLILAPGNKKPPSASAVARVARRYLVS